ncbi:DUF413 domain-containing protein [Constantimarinum furrinae]|uniref:Macrodomain Ori protein n=1 Tax=Constantimarinum furrinae TaxID=2562285 RepID=A0A7G8PRQ9_9FLAO|nr:DUF413 domain-containing protein [Constantimarinum furrinae]QNJ97025.1 hypothetical protein ALE3EI_0442 [Constantimarinum furrinae]
MSQTPSKKQHLNYIKKCGPFKIDCNRIIFSNEEIEILEKYGHWFTALEDGTLKPLSERQKLFIDVAKGLKKPVSSEETAWFKYTRRRQIEKESGNSLYNTPVLENNEFYSRQDYLKQKQIMQKTNWENSGKAVQLKFLK